MNVNRAQEWYRQGNLGGGVESAGNFGQADVKTFLTALLQTLLSTSETDSFPDTFYLDIERLQDIRAELNDILFFHICSQILLNLLGQLGSGERLMSDRDWHALQSRLVAVVDGSSKKDPRDAWLFALENVAVEIVRSAVLICGHNWSCGASYFHSTERNLRRAFASSVTTEYLEASASIYSALFPLVVRPIQTYLNRSPIDIFNALVQPAPTSSTFALTIVSSLVAPANASCFPLKSSSTIGIEDSFGVVSRIAHIAILHWRTWGSIVYTCDLSRTK